MYLDIPKIEHCDNEKMFFITDNDGIIQFISFGSKVVLDSSPDNIVYKLHYFDLFLSKYKKDIESRVFETIKKKERKTGQIPVKLNKQSTKKDLYLILNILYNKTGKLKGVFGELGCKNEKKEKEWLVDIEKKYRQLIDNIPLGIYRTTIEGEIAFVNKGFLDIFHYKSAQEIKKINIKEFFVDEFYRSASINDWVNEEHYVVEFQAYTKNKEVIWIKDEGRAIKDLNGKIVYFDGILEDISLKKTAEDKLKELNISKDKFLSIISHDLKTPFGQFISATELILDKIHEYDTSQIEKLIGLLNEQAVQSYKLLENLLEWSRSQKGLIKFDPGPICLEAITEEIIDSLKQMATNKSISVTSNIKKGLFIYADKYMLSTIFRNLISNAIKFTNEHGKVTISSRYFMQKKSLGDKMLEISVADTGMGIRGEEISKLFRIDTASSTKGTNKESGTGLGLILCKEFVEKHGGQIWVESEVDKGSVFKFTIP
ncbi:MAG: PAS domain-containing sensor histidine kinase [Bacteroidota bacterium]